MGMGTKILNWLERSVMAVSAKNQAMYATSGSLTDGMNPREREDAVFEAVQKRTAAATEMDACFILEGGDGRSDRTEYQLPAEEVGEGESFRPHPSPFSNGMRYRGVDGRLLVTPFGLNEIYSNSFAEISPATDCYVWDSVDTPAKEYEDMGIEVARTVDEEAVRELDYALDEYGCKEKDAGRIHPASTSPFPVEG